MINVDKQKLQEYVDIVQKVASVEFRRVPPHMLDREELVSIGIIAIQVLINNKTPQQLERYNAAYIATAVRWAIRNELRIRYKWYSLKHQDEAEEDEELLMGVKMLEKLSEIVTHYYSLGFNTVHIFFER